MHLNISSTEWWPFCAGGDELRNHKGNWNLIVSRYISQLPWCPCRWTKPSVAYRWDLWTVPWQEACLWYQAGLVMPSTWVTIQASWIWVFTSLSVFIIRTCVPTVSHLQCGLNGTTGQTLVLCSILAPGIIFPKVTTKYVYEFKSSNHFNSGLPKFND